MTSSSVRLTEFTEVRLAVFPEVARVVLNDFIANKNIGLIAEAAGRPVKEVNKLFQAQLAEARQDPHLYFECDRYRSAAHMTATMLGLTPNFCIWR